MATTMAHSISHRIGQLCVGGDWACAHGDLEALRFVARELADAATEPLHQDLIALADECYADPNHAVASWLQLKERFPPGGEWGSPISR
jgi:hypothetical protein